MFASSQLAFIRTFHFGWRIKTYSRYRTIFFKTNDIHHYIGLLKKFTWRFNISFILFSIFWCWTDIRFSELDLQQFSSCINITHNLFNCKLTHYTFHEQNTDTWTSIATNLPTCMSFSPIILHLQPEPEPCFDFYNYSRLW